MLSGIKFKGVAFVHTNKYIVKTYGEDTLQRILSFMPEVSRQEVADAAISVWYPVEYASYYLASLQRVLGRGDTQIIFKVSKEAGKEAFSLLYKVFFRLGNPGWVIERAPSIWRTVSTQGFLNVVERDAKHVVVRLTNFDYRDTLFCGERLRALIQAPLELSGCEITESLHTVCVAKGGPYCEWRYTWK